MNLNNFIKEKLIISNKTDFMSVGASWNLPKATLIIALSTTLLACAGSPYKSIEFRRTHCENEKTFDG